MRVEFDRRCGPIERIWLRPGEGRGRQPVIGRNAGSAGGRRRRLLAPSQPCRKEMGGRKDAATSDPHALPTAITFRDQRIRPDFRPIKHRLIETNPNVKIAPHHRQLVS